MALSDHDENLTKTVYVDGKYKRFRSLPIKLSLDLMKRWREELSDELKQELENVLTNADVGCDCDDVGADYVPEL